jgi:predicted transcriptional regulator
MIDRARVAGLGGCGYTRGMKTAISIPNEVFDQAEALARSTHQSRSQLYSRAVREYVARHSTDSVTAALDAVLAHEDPDSGFAVEASRRILEGTEW